MNIKLYCLKVLIVLVLVHCFDHKSYAQNVISVKGQVLDEDNLAIPGVSIKVKGKQQGTVTDLSGNYVISGVSSSDILVFTFLGYENQEQAIQDRIAINVVLRESAKALDEVVVVAYGTQQKLSVTGALTTVKGEDLAKSPSVNLVESLVGRTSGLLAQQSSGQPGNDAVSIRIRGSSTFNSNSSPLVLVDGVERPFNSINAEEVENLTVLKDASTTAVYGIRGANGVILVTTKRGKTGKTAVSFSSNLALQSPTRLPEFANAYDYATLYNEALYNDNPNQTPLFTAEDLRKFQDGSDPIFNPDINWFEFMMNKTAPQSKSTLTLNGGGPSAKYFISIGYISQQGLWKEFNEQFGYSNNTNYNRYNFRSNVDFNLTKSTVFGLSLGGYSDKLHTAGNPFSAIQSTPSLITPGLIGDKLIVNNTIAYRNPIVSLSEGYEERFENQFNITADLNQSLEGLVKGLSFRSKLGYDSDYRTVIGRNVTRPTYNPIRTVVNGAETIILQPLGDLSTGGVGTQEFDSRSKRVYFEGAIQFDRLYGKHRVGGLLLYNQNKQFWPSSRSYDVEYPEVAIGYLGTVGRLTYNYDQRYLLEASVGRNGSENFPAGRRYGIFPAISAGWNVTREPWVQKALGGKSVLSLLKFRTSYGETGNDKIIDNNGVYQRFMYFPSEYTTAINRVRFGEEFTSYQGVIEGQLGNPDITWEKAIKQNYAIETSFFGEKLNFNFDYFIDYRNNILFQKPAIAHVAAAIQDVYNVARIRNKGYEIELGWNSKIGNISYFINGNYTFARNRVLENGTPESPQNQLGNSLNQPYGLTALGFFNRQDEADNWPLQYASKSSPGDVKYMDSNGDGKVDENDFMPIGDPTYPEINFGTSLGMSFKGLDFSVLFQGAENVSRVISGFMQRPGSQFGTMLAVVKDQRWTPENTENAKLPKLTATYSNASNYTNSSLWLRDASYLRLKNVELGYRFSSSLLKKAGVNTARVFFSGQNLITWDKLKLVDPEQQASNSFSYPQLQLFNAGLNIQF